jgi:hypothetical protein
MTRCQCNQYSTKRRQYGVQLQEFHNISNYLLFQFFLLDLISWQTPCRFLHCPLFKVFHSAEHQCFHSLHIANCAHGLPKTWCTLSPGDRSRTYPKLTEYFVPSMVCGFTMLATGFWRPQVMTAVHNSLSNVMNHCQT